MGRPNVPVKCKYCGKEFLTFAHYLRRGGGKYCSRECYLKDKDSRVTKVCLHCGKVFTLTKAEARKGKRERKYCSRSCSQKAHYNPERELTCAHCGKKKVVSSVHLASRKYYGAKNFFCSLSCKAAWQRVNLMGKNNPHWRNGTRYYRRRDRKVWQRFSKLIKERDNNTCQRCGSEGKGFHVHHIIEVEERPELEFDPKNCITLCAGCHCFYHRY